MENKMCLDMEGKLNFKGLVTRCMCPREVQWVCDSTCALKTGQVVEMAST